MKDGHANSHRINFNSRRNARDIIYFSARYSRAQNKPSPDAVPDDAMMAVLLADTRHSSAHITLILTTDQASIKTAIYTFYISIVSLG